MSHYNSKKYNPDFEIDGLYLKLANLASKEFKKLFSEKYSLENYICEFRKESIDSEETHYWVISMIPKPQNNSDYSSPEIPVQGLWQNGPGVSFSFLTSDYTLVQTTRMR